MLSARLIHTIEQHWEQITERVIQQVRWDASLYELGKFPESDLRERSREILENLGAQLTVKKDDLILRQEAMGKRRFEDNIPLHEVVHALHLIKNKTIEYVRDQGLGDTTLEVYAEEEFEYSVNRLFDEMVYRVVRGYERTMRDAFSNSRVAGQPLRGR